MHSDNLYRFYPRIFELLRIIMTHYKTTFSTLLDPGLISINLSAFNSDGTNYLSSHQIATHCPPRCHTRLINTHMWPGGVIPATKLPLAFGEKRIRRHKYLADGLKRLAR